MIEQARCNAHSGMEKSISSLEGQNKELSDKLHEVAENFRELIGELKPVIKKMDKMVDDQQKINKEIQIARGESGTVKTNLKTYQDEHKESHASLNWAVGIVCTIVFGGGLAFVFKIAGAL